MATPPTWHHGLVAEWWARFNLDGPEIDRYGRIVAAGQPALDAGCGAGRLLVPWRRAGFDVDGADAAADMIARCRERLRAEGLDATLAVQPLHALDMPRRYRTIVACGVLGLGSTRRQDEAALARFHGLLEPGGTLVLDNEPPYANPRRWVQWTRAERARLPEPWPDAWERRVGDDGTAFALRTRAVAADPLDQTVRLEIEVTRSRAGEEPAVERHELSMRGYLRDELVTMLRLAGFTQVDVRGEDAESAATADDDVLVFLARR
jgi:SAM-dependent methyltransferase